MSGYGAGVQPLIVSRVFRFRRDGHEIYVGPDRVLVLCGDQSVAQCSATLAGAEVIEGNMIVLCRVMRSLLYSLCSELEFLDDRALGGADS